MATKFNRRKPRAGFGVFEEPVKGEVPDALLKQARKSGTLNLSGRGLIEVPAKVWKINIDQPPESKTVSMDDADDRWWEQDPLTKLILSSNSISSISDDIHLLESLSFLDIHDNMVTALPEGLMECSQLQHLNINHNKLRHLPPWIEQLTQLSTIHVSHNHLELLGAGLCKLESLNHLDLSHNKLRALPQGFGRLRKLRFLNLSNNQLDQLPQDIAGLKSVVQLDLSNNALTSLPVEMGEMSGLEQLFLRHNKLSQLPVLENCHKLKELQVGNNSLRELLGGQLRYLNSVQVLDLRDNHIVSLPDDICELDQLQRLDLTNNDITTLPYSLGNLTTLNALCLDGNPMRSIRRDIITRGTQEILKYLRSRIVSEEKEEGTKLKETSGQSGVIGAGGDDVDAHEMNASKSLDLSKRKFSELPLEVVEAAMNSEIRRANLSYNLLTSFPDSFVGVSNTLTELNLKSNKLTQLHPDIGLFLSLEFLDVSGNQLQDLPDEMYSMKEMRELNISMNRFSKIPDTVYNWRCLESILASDNRIETIDVTNLLKLTRIQALDLSNNSVSHIPPELGNVETLRSLQLGGNTFRQPRPAILAKGTVALLEYLRSRIPT